jgi:hypothetical protein
VQSFSLIQDRGCASRVVDSDQVKSPDEICDETLNSAASYVSVSEIVLLILVLLRLLKLRIRSLA